MRDWMIGAVGVPMCFLLNGLSFIRGNRRFAVDAAAKIQTRDRRLAGQARMGRDCLFSQTSTCAHDFVVVPAIGIFGWSYMVLMPAFARDVLGRGANGYGVLCRPVAQVRSWACWSWQLTVICFSPADSRSVEFGCSRRVSSRWR